MPNLVQRTLLTCLFLLSLTSLSAQIRIAGRATDKTTGDGIPFAAVKILSPDSVLVTGQMADSAGSFSFTGLRPAAYLLELSALGYETLHVPQSFFSQSWDITPDGHRMLLNLTGEDANQSRAVLVTDWPSRVVKK